MRMLVAIVSVGLLLMGCSRSNNLLFGRVEAMVAGHTVVVTDCYRTTVPPPVQEPTGATFTPCRDAVVVIHNEQLTVNGTQYRAARAPRESPCRPRARVDSNPVGVLGPKSGALSDPCCLLSLLAGPRLRA